MSAARMYATPGKCAKCGGAFFPANCPECGAVELRDICPACLKLREEDQHEQR